MRLSLFALAAQLLVAEAASPRDALAKSQWPRPATLVNSTCHQLSGALPDSVFYPNSSAYTDLNEDFFSAAAWLGPACIVAPTSAAAMGAAVQVLTRSGVPFALRGGGHMPIRGAANINSSGILVSSSGLTQLQLSADQSTVAVGPGNRWGDVYRYLEPYGRAVVAGRMGVVGVPGFLLGGGISFFGNEHGWASANIASFEVVLASGRVVTATATNAYADLFWALRGGGSNYGIVTSFALRTLAAPRVSVGQTAYGAGVRDAFLDSVYGYAFNGTLDRKSSVTPTANYMPSVYGSQPYYTAMLFYNGNDTSPAALANFTGGNTAGGGLPAPTTSTLAYRTMANWANESETGFDRVHGLRFRFHVVSMVADRAAMEAVHDTFMDLAAERLANVTGLQATLAVMPISRSFIESNRGPSPSADPFGIDASRAPYIWVEQAIMYADAADDDKISAFSAEANAAIDAALAALPNSSTITSPYLYVNDADADQPVFEGYGAANLARLQRIRDKYDPRGVYTYQMPGGFKVASA